jgi:hypothetical protein
LKAPFLIAENYLREGPEPAPDSRLTAVLICSHVLQDHVWLALADRDPYGDGLAVYSPDELEFLKDKDAETLREIHRVKLAFGGGGRVRQ